MNKSIAIFSALILTANLSWADAFKAGDAVIEPHMDTYGYLPRVEAESDMERGEQVYVQWCAICHSDGPGMAGTTVLQMRYKGSIPALLQERTDLTGEYLEPYVREGMGSMPFFRKTEITDEDFDALVVYLTQNSEQ